MKAVVAVGRGYGWIDAGVHAGADGTAATAQPPTPTTAPDGAGNAPDGENPQPPRAAFCFIKTKGKEFRQRQNSFCLCLSKAKRAAILEKSQLAGILGK